MNIPHTSDASFSAPLSAELGQPPPGLTEPKLLPLEVLTVDDRFQACVTTELVDGKAPQESRSPLDQFIATTKLLNVLSRSRSSFPAVSDADESPANDQFEDLLAISEESDVATDETQDGMLSAEAPSSSTETSPDSILIVENPLRSKSDAVMTGQQVGASTDHGSRSSSDGRINDPDEANTNMVQVQPAQAENVPSNAEIDFQLNGLVLLGFISSVESYLRNLTTRLVYADEFVEKKAEDQKLTYGAARYHSKELLAEAFLEEITLISKEHVETLLRSVLGLQSFGDKFGIFINEYDRICQLRHCIVHRFGKLGSKNAIKLGLKQHNELIEKPIRISADELQNISLNLLNLVQIINNIVYDCVMRRQAQQSPEWRWNFEEDKERFERLYLIFQSSEGIESSKSSSDAYATFKEQCEYGGVANKERQKAKREFKALKTKMVVRPATSSGIDR